MPIQDTSTFSGLMNSTQGTGGINNNVALPGSNNMVTPGMNLPGFNSQSVNGSNVATTPQQVYQLLGQANPQSIANSIGPLLAQVFGTQGNIMQPIFQQQTNQGVAQAQSNAQQRGLTGSTIEQAGMQAAQTQGNQSFEQYLAGQLNNLVPAYQSALTTDVSNQTGYFNNLAQAVGQQYGNQQQYNEFLQQLQATQSMASQANSAALESAGIQAAGNILSPSDIRLKENINPIGQYKGINVYSFTFKQDTPFDLPKGRQVGCLGHEVYDKRPDCVCVKKGYFHVNYSKLAEENNA